MLGNVLNIAFVKFNHAFRQSKYRQAIDTLMGEEAPGA
jgi:hypothetical protein